MSNNMLEVFHNDSFGDVRTVYEDGQSWLVLKDVCDMLGIVNSRNVFNRLPEDEKGVRLMDTPGGKQNVQVVNEPGLYRVILRSDSDKTEPFVRWIAHDVLPSIRLKGYYSSIPDDDLAELLVANMNDEERLKRIIIPAMRKSYAIPPDVVAGYLGIEDSDRTKYKALWTKSAENDIGRSYIESWVNAGLGDYTMKDIPEQYSEQIDFNYIFDEVRRRRANRQNIRKVFEDWHFNKFFYRDLVKTVAKYYFLSDEAVNDWMAAMDLYFPGEGAKEADPT